MGADLVYDVLADRDKCLWFATMGGGVSRYDGRQMKSYTIDNGLASNYVISVEIDRRQRLWFCTFGGGVSCFDGQVFQTFTKKDGLINDVVHDALEDREGRLWFCTEGGVIRYTAQDDKPKVVIRQVIADQLVRGQEAVIVSEVQNRVCFEVLGRSFTDHWKHLVYVYRLEGHHKDKEWRVSNEGQIVFEGLAKGEYTFSVKAVDRDLNYSDPCHQKLLVVPDPHIEGWKDIVKGGVIDQKIDRPLSGDGGGAGRGQEGGGH